jgi:hypothetical protein
VDRTEASRRLITAGLVTWLVAASLCVSVGATRPAAAASPRPDSLSLTSQSPSWVGPDPTHQVLTLVVRLSSGARRHDLGLQLTVYRHLGDRFHLNETLSGRGLGTVATRSPVLDVGSLPTDAQGEVRVTVPVLADAAPATSGTWTADLGCQLGSCAGVYPLKVALTDTASPGSAGPSFVTYLIYDNPIATSQPLRVSLVVPEGVPVVTATPAGQLPGPGGADVARLEGLVTAIANAGEVPVTLVPDPATVGALSAAGRQRVVSVLAALSASTARQTLAQSFVPIDPTALADAGLGGELTEQIRRAGQVLGALAPGGRVGRGTWVVTGNVDAAALAQLAPDYGHVVVPPSALAGALPSRTPTQPFVLSASSGATPTGTPSPGTTGRGVPVTGAVSDPALGAHLAMGAGADPALAAVQFLADASLIYYELPNLATPRAVVAVAPTAWAPNPSFVSAVLGALPGNPVLAPVTVDQLFQQVPVGADGQPTQRRPASSATGTAAVPARSIRTARGMQQAFASAVSGTSPGDAVAQALDDLLLRAESSELTTRQQQSGVTGFTAALDAQLHQLSVRSDTVRLTSGAASVPITVLRNAPYAVTAVVRVTSDKLVFPRGVPAADARCKAPVVQSSAGRSSFAALCVLDHGTTAVYVDMRSRASGDFRIDVTLTCPQGNLVLASGHLTVRSMSTSAVAIALSAVAAGVLVAWWGRTLWRNRFGRRGAHGRGAAARAASGSTSPNETSPSDTSPGDGAAGTEATTRGTT